MSFQRPFLIQLRRQRPGHPWGFVLTGDRDSDHQLKIYKVAPDGLAEQAGLRAGDELIQVGRLNVQDMAQEQVQDIISGAGDRLEMFVIREDPAHSRKVQTEQHQTVKTLVHNQYNSPIHLYSEENIDETIARHTEALTNGLAGFDLGLTKKFPETPPTVQRSAVVQVLRETEGDTRKTTYENQVTERYVSSSTVSTSGQRKQPPPPPPKPQPPAQVHSGRPSSPELKRHVSTAVYTPSPVATPSRPQFPTSPGGQQQYYNQTSATPSSPQQYYNQTSAIPSSPQQYYNQTSATPSSPQQYYNQTSATPSSPQQYYNQTSTTPSTQKRYYSQKLRQEEEYNRQQQYYNQPPATPSSQHQYYNQAPATPSGQSYHQGPPSAGIAYTSAPPEWPQARQGSVPVRKQPPDFATSTVSTVAHQWPPEHQHLGTRSSKMPEDMSRPQQRGCTFSSNIPNYSPTSSPMNLRKGKPAAWPPKQSSVKEVPKTGFSPAVTREHGQGKRFIWPPPDLYEQFSREGSFTPPVRVPGTPPIANAWHPVSPSPYQARSPPFARSPSLTRRCLDVVWPPPQPDEYQVLNVKSKPYKRLSRFEDHITQTASVGVPPTYRPPPGTHHVDVGY